jgi:transcriptional regulator with XRE-family HTH domain
LTFVNGNVKVHAGPYCLQKEVNAMHQEALPEKLRVLRARKGWGVVEAANAIGIDPHTLRDLELGSRKPRYPTIAKISKAYGTPTEFLLGEGVVEKSPAAPVSPEYPYAWMSDTLARTIGQWQTEVTNRRVEGPRAEMIGDACRDILWAVLRFDAPGGELKDRVPESEVEQRVLFCEQLASIMSVAWKIYRDSNKADPERVSVHEEEAQEMRAQLSLIAGGVAS